MQLLGKRQSTLMSKKYFSMLLGGTLNIMVISLLLMSDSVIAGVIIDSDAVAGVTLVTPLYSFATFWGSVISLGVPILYSTEMGKFNKERANQAFGLGMLMSIVVGIVLFILTSLFGEMYLRNCSDSEAILAQAMGYLSWMRFTILVLPLQTLLSSAVYGDGDEKISTLATGIQGVGNIVFSIGLSFVMGIRGIGLASFLFFTISALILLLHFKKESNSLRLNLFFSVEMLKKVVHYSIIDSSAYLFLSVFAFALNLFVNNWFGSKYLILVSVFTLSREFQMLFDGIGQAVGPILSVYVGEQNRNGLRSIYSLSQKTAIVEGVAVTLILMVVAPFVPNVLKVTDPELVRYVESGTRISVLGATFISLLYLLTSYYLVIDQIPLGLAACALRDVILSTSLAVAFGKIFGIYGMFWGLAVAPAIAYGGLMLFLILRYGRGNCPLLLSKVPGDNRCYSFDLTVEPKQIIDVQENVESLLAENNVDLRTIGKVKLLIEEAYMLIWEKNKNKTVLSELSVFLRPEGIQIITKDDGVLLDISEEDVSVTSMVSFAVSAYMEKLGKDRSYLTTMSFNRSVFFIKPLPDGKETGL